MNILNMLQVYAQKWQVKNQRGFTQEELADISSAKVVASQYGNSVCLTLVGVDRAIFLCRRIHNSLLERKLTSARLSF